MDGATSELQAGGCLGDSQARPGCQYASRRRLAVTVRGGGSRHQERRRPLRRSHRSLYERQRRPWLLLRRSHRSLYERQRRPWLLLRRSRRTRRGRRHLWSGSWPWLWWQIASSAACSSGGRGGRGAGARSISDPRPASPSPHGRPSGGAGVVGHLVQWSWVFGCQAPDAAATQLGGRGQQGLCCSPMRRRFSWLALQRSAAAEIQHALHQPARKKI